MRILLWAECQKLRRSNILMLNAFAIVFIAVIVLIGGKTTVDGVDFSESSGWYMATTLTWATMFVLPAMTALMGSYMICRAASELSEAVPKGYIHQFSHKRQAGRLSCRH